VQAVFDRSCAASECHSGRFPAAGLDLSRDSSYARLVDVPSFACDPLVRVRPYRPDSSCLVQRLSGEVGPQMPAGGTITAAELATIRHWIEVGAPPTRVTLASARAR
jgi:hypothetical protein